MKLLNLCCGAVRPQSDGWINVDNLHATIVPGTPERENLDRERNYWNMDVEEGLRLGQDWADGILMSHCLEHWDCQTGVKIMRDCWNILKPGGVLLVSVPDAELFKKNYSIDDGSNSVELYGEPIFEGDGEKTFVNYAMWNRWHKAIIDETVLWHYFKRAGFGKCGKIQVERDGDDTLTRTKIHFPWDIDEGDKPVMMELTRKLNRIPFSLVCVGVKE